MSPRYEGEARGEKQVERSGRSHQCAGRLAWARTATCMRGRSYSQGVDPRLSGYCSLERIVLIPAYREELYGPAIDDLDSLVVCPVSIPDADLGAVVIRLLRGQRPRDFEMDFRGEAHRRRLAVRRRLLCKAFGVKAAKDWLAGSTYVSVVAAGGSMTAAAWRRYGKQDTWSGRKDDPVGTASLADPAKVGSTVRRMLALRLPPIR